MKWCPGAMQNHSGTGGPFFVFYILFLFYILQRAVLHSLDIFVGISMHNKWPVSRRYREHSEWTTHTFTLLWLPSFLTPSHLYPQLYAFIFIYILIFIHVYMCVCVSVYNIKGYSSVFLLTLLSRSSLYLCLFCSSLYIMSTSYFLFYLFIFAFLFAYLVIFISLVVDWKVVRHANDQKSDLLQ